MASWYEGWFGASRPCFAGRLLSTEVLRSISLRTEQDAGGESWEQGNSQQGASQEQGRSVHHQGFRVTDHYRLTGREGSCASPPAGTGSSSCPSRQAVCARRVLGRFSPLLWVGELQSTAQIHSGSVKLLTWRNNEQNRYPGRCRLQDVIELHKGTVLDNDPRRWLFRAV